MLHIPCDVVDSYCSECAFDRLNHVEGSTVDQSRQFLLLVRCFYYGKDSFDRVEKWTVRDIEYQLYVVTLAQ